MYSNMDSSTLASRSGISEFMRSVLTNQLYPRRRPSFVRGRTSIPAGSCFQQIDLYNYAHTQSNTHYTYIVYVFGVLLPVAALGSTYIFSGAGFSYFFYSFGGAGTGLFITFLTFYINFEVTSES
jgi:VIT1/CCC1 family predicted Fe2+/Mn2+ transporter